MGAYCDITVILALGAVVGVPFYTFWPPLNGSVQSESLTGVLVSRDVDPTGKTVNITWSSFGPVPDNRPVDINHFCATVAESRCHSECH